MMPWSSHAQETEQAAPLRLELFGVNVLRDLGFSVGSFARCATQLGARCYPEK